MLQLFATKLNVDGGSLVAHFYRGWLRDIICPILLQIFIEESHI